MTIEPLQEPSTAPDFGLEVPRERNRLTAAFRIIIAIPHLVVLTITGIGAGVAVLAGWFAALAMGRLPAPIARFLGRWISYAAGVNAYVWLLTDRFPRFSFQDPDQPVGPGHPVRAAFTPTPLNRLAVLFRLILAIPAYLLSILSMTGLWIFGFVAWLIILATGRVPDALYNALAVVLRYTMRFYAYMALITGLYPWGLFGDRPGIATPMPAMVEPGEPASDDVPAVPDDVPAAPATDVRDRFVLSGGAKGIVAAALVLGVMGQGVAAVNRAGGIAHVVAYVQFTEVYEDFERRSNPHVDRMQACRTVQCFRRETGEVAAAARGFADDLSDISFPEDVRPKVVGVLITAQQFADVFQSLSDARTPAQFDRIFAESDIEQLRTAFDRAVNALAEALRNPG